VYKKLSSPSGQYEYQMYKYILFRLTKTGGYYKVARSQILD